MRAPILINGDANFTEANGVNGGGSGTAEDPYIIENWEINASAAHGIDIGNTTAYFVVRNCVVENGWIAEDEEEGNYYGIKLDNVVNGRIENNTCENNGSGIYLTYSDYTNLTNNTCSNNYIEGIYLTYSDYDNLTNNTCENNSQRGINLYSGSFYDNLTNNTCSNNYDGIWLFYAYYNNVTGNTCENNTRGGIYQRNSPYCNLTANTCENNNWAGIIVEFLCENSNLTGNTCENNPRGIYLLGANNNIILTNNTVRNSSYAGIYLSGSDNDSVTGNTCENNTRGIYLFSGCEYNSLTGNTCENNENGIYLNLSSYNSLTGNTCENNTRGIYLYRSSYNSLTGNTCENNPRGIYLDNSSYDNLTNNTCSNNTYGIYLNYSENVNLTNNTCENKGYGIYLNYSDYDNLTGNTCENNTQSGISLYSGSDYDSLTGNTCSNNTYDIRLFYAYYNNVTGNTCDNGTFGIYQRSSPYCNLTANTVKNTSYGGIFVEFFCENSNLTGNTCSNNHCGIYLIGPGNNITLTNNTCVNNEVGIYNTNSTPSNNLICHNNLVNNVSQAYDDGITFWDNGYPSGGNYWSDYTGVDIYSGVNQDIPGSDGIGDTPYQIPGGTGQDRYPLMPSVCGVEVTIEWIRQFGTSAVDRAYGMAVGGSDNIYVAGLTYGTLPGQTSSGANDAFVRKYDGSGNELWTRQFGSSADDYAMGVAVDSSDNVYITGITWGTLPGQTSSGGTDAFVRKYDSAGNEIWTIQFGTSASDRATGVVVDGSNNIYVMGYTNDALPGQTYSGDTDAFVRKYDSAGNEIWTRQFGTSAFDDVRDVAVDSSDNVYVAGLTLGALPGQDNLGSYDAFVRKYDGAGNEIWTKQFGTSDEDYGYGVAVDGSDNVYVAGDTKGALPGQTFSGGRDGYIRKYDGDGNELWTRQFGTSDIDRVGDVAVDGSNNAYLLGITSGTFPGQTSSGGYDAFVREYDSAGNEIWTRQFGSSADDYVGSVAVDSSNKVYASGYTYGTLSGQTSSGNVDAFLVKFAVFTGGIEVTIENSLLEGYPSQVLEYTIDVHNSGNVVDNIMLSYIPDGWPDITIVPQVLTDVMPSEHRQVTMFVHVPDNAIGCTYKEITVVAESQFCGATDNDTTQAHVTEQLENFTLQLLTGWNLVCFPVTAVTNTPTNIFAGLTWSVDYTIYSWTAPGGPYILIGPTDVLQDNLAYWVLVTADQTITWNGTQPTSRDVYLVTGWNMAGFPVVNGSTTPTNIFTGLTWGVDYNIYWWTAPGGPYILLGPTDLFLDNTGYWVYVNADKVVTVP